MEAILILILLLVVLICWIFSTSTTVNNSHTGTKVLIVKSFFYWVAVILSFCVGIYVN